MPSINTEARPSNCSAGLANHSSTEWQPYTISLYDDSHTPLSLYDEKDLSSFSCLPEVGGGVSYLNRLQQLRDTFVCSFSSKFLIVLNHPYLVGCLPLLQNKSLLFSMYMKDKKIARQNKLLNNSISRLYVHWQSTGTTPLFVWCGEIFVHGSWFKVAVHIEWPFVIPFTISPCTSYCYDCPAYSNCLNK